MAKTTFNPFAQKSTVSATDTKKKTARTQVKVTGKDFAKVVKDYKKAKQDLANAEAAVATAQDIIKDKGKTEFVRLYASNKRNPDTFDVVTEEGEVVMIQPKDAYKKISGERAAELTEKYGEDVVEEKTTFTFDPEILAKHGDALGKLIMGAKFLTEEEKMKLIVPQTTVSIKKGAIDEAMTTGKGNVEEPNERRVFFFSKTCLIFVEL